jgi:hypothetical protein
MVNNLDKWIESQSWRSNRSIAMRVRQPKEGLAVTINGFLKTLERSFTIILTILINLSKLHEDEAFKNSNLCLTMKMWSLMSLICPTIPTTKKLRINFIAKCGKMIWLEESVIKKEISITLFKVVELLLNKMATQSLILMNL